MISVKHVTGKVPLMVLMVGWEDVKRGAGAWGRGWAMLGVSHQPEASPE